MQFMNHCMRNAGTILPSWKCNLSSKMVWLPISHMTMNRIAMAFSHVWTWLGGGGVELSKKTSKWELYFSSTLL